MPARSILIADPDERTQRVLAPELRARGFQVHAAADGTRALELSVLRYPDLILYDEKCRLLDPPTFLQILRSNPRTDRIPVLLTGTREVEVGAHEHYLRKPCNVDELLARYHAVIHLRTPAEDRGYNKQNPLRTESAAAAAEVDRRILQAWRSHPKRFIVESASEFLDKAAETLEILRDEMPDCCKRHVVPAIH